MQTKKYYLSLRLLPHITPNSSHVLHSPVTAPSPQHKGKAGDDATKVLYHADSDHVYNDFSSGTYEDGLLT